MRAQSPASLVPSAPPAARDDRAERIWLGAAERAAGASHFAAHALRRLDAGQAAYGDRWATLSLDQLITELSEEAADLGAWGVLALQALERRSASPALAARLHAAILAGARAHRELEQARVALHHGQTIDARRFLPDVDGRCLHCGRAYSGHADSRCGRREPQPPGGAA